MTEFVQIAAHETSRTFNIAGLEFAPNRFQELDQRDGWFSLKVKSSPGPLVSDFVTHGPDFRYATSGIHIGQDDRLTFFGDTNRMIEGYFVDCRKGSSTLHAKVQARFAPSPFRRLIIPRGVAHTFDGLAGIVTRDEPVWYASSDNPHWNVNNDLVSVLREETEYPELPVNNDRLPESLHLYMTQLSQAVLTEPKAYSSRFLLKIAGKEQYVMFQENSWADEAKQLDPLVNAVRGPGIESRRSKYAITGKASWTLVPNTGAGVCDVLLLNAQDQRAHTLYVHRRTRKYYTILNNEGGRVVIETVDLRPNSMTFLVKRKFESKADPRVTYVVEPGVGYRIAAPAYTYIRSEHDVFADETEPRTDIPMFGNDLEVIDEDNISGVQPCLPALQCPPGVIRSMAAFELEA